MTLLDAFVFEVEEFLARNRMAATTFGQNAFKDPNFVFDLRKGRCPNLRVIERAREFMAEADGKEKPRPMPSNTLRMTADP